MNAVEIARLRALLARAEERARNAEHKLGDAQSRAAQAEAHAAMLRSALEAQPLVAGSDELSLRAAQLRLDALDATPASCAAELAALRRCAEATRAAALSSFDGDCWCSFAQLHNHFHRDACTRLRKAMVDLAALDAAKQGGAT